MSATRKISGRARTASGGKALAEKIVGRTFGREHELEQIGAALCSALTGKGSELFLVGEGGVGKTRLLRESAALAEAMGFAVLLSAAPATFRPPPYGLLSATLRSLLRQSAIDFTSIEAFVPGLRLMLPEWPVAREAPGLSDDQLRLLALEGALLLLTRANANRPTLVVLDDLHNTDPETIEFLVHASFSASSAPLVIIGALRTGEQSQAEPEVLGMSQAGRVQVLQVGGLDPNAAKSLIQEVIGVAPPDGLVNEIVSTTDGNPLLVQELTEAMLETHAFRIAGTTVEWPGRSRSIVPRSIGEQVSQRLGRLNPATRLLVRSVAVLGRSDADLAATVASLDTQAFDAARGEALAAGVMVPGEGIGFRHALVREAVLYSALPRELDELHSRAAAAIATMRGNDPQWLEERAGHLVENGALDEAAELLLSVGRHNLAASGPASAEVVLQRAIDLKPSLGILASLYDLLSETLTTLGRWEKSLRLDLESVATSLPTSQRLLRMARSAILLGRLEEAEGYLAQAREHGADAGLLASSRALLSLWRGDFEQAVQAGRTAVAIGEDIQDPSLVCSGLDIVGRASDELGRRGDAVEAFSRWAEVAERAGLPASHAQALMELGNVEFMTTYIPDRLRETRALAREAGAYPTLVLADLSLVWCLGATDDLSEALTIGEEALDFARRFELDLLPHVVEALGWARGRQKHGAGDALLDEAVALAPDDADILVQAYDASADWLIRAGRFEDALAQLERAVEIMLSNRAAVPLVAPAKRACALMALGRDGEAADALEQARTFATSPRLLIVPMWVEAAAAMLQHSPGALERAVPADTTVAYERATLLSLGAQMIAGEHARGWLREALAIFEHAGAEDDAARTRRLLRERGASVPRARRKTAAVADELRARGVTRREAEVLHLVGLGLSNNEIADKLFLSVRTVESHISSLLTKLQVETRAALIASAMSIARSGPH